MTKPTSKRRQFLRGAGLTAAALAGCVTSSTDEGAPPSTSTATDSPTATSTATATETETETPTETDPAAAYPWFVDRGEVVDDFETFEADWDVTFGDASLEGGGFLEGSSVRMTTAGDNRGRIVRKFAVPKDVSDRDVTMALNLQSTTKESFGLSVVLVDSGGNRRYHSRTLLPSASDTWVHLNMAFDTERGSFDETSVTELWVEHFAGSGESTFHVDDLRTVEKPDRGAVVFTFDDACPDEYDVAFPVLSEYGYGGVCFPPSTYVTENTNPSIEEYQEMRDAGWDVGGHTPGHEHLFNHSAADQRDLFETNTAQLREKGLAGSDEPLHFRTPYGNYDSNTLDVVLEEFATCIGGAGSAVGTSFYVNDPRMLGFRSGEDLERAKSLVDEAAEQRQLLGFTIHMSNVGREHMEQLVYYVSEYEQAGDLDVLTMSEYYEKALA